MQISASNLCVCSMFSFFLLDDCAINFPLLNAFDASQSVANLSVDPILRGSFFYFSEDNQTKEF